MENSTLISSPLGLVQEEFGPAESVLSTMGQWSHASNFRLDLSPVILWEAREEREFLPVLLSTSRKYRSLVTLYKHFEFVSRRCVIRGCVPKKLLVYG